jgi:hypothetical protein
MTDLHNLYMEAAIYGYDPEDVDSGEFDWDDVEERESTVEENDN